jgi:hypothetical protein
MTSGYRLPESSSETDQVLNIARDTAIRLAQQGEPTKSFTVHPETVTGWLIFEYVAHHNSKGNSKPWFQWTSINAGLLIPDGSLWAYDKAWGFHDDHNGGVVDQRSLREEGRAMIARVGAKQLIAFLTRM